MNFANPQEHIPEAEQESARKDFKQRVIACPTTIFPES
jgi:hypothetical protein